MYDCIVTAPFVERLGDGTTKERKVGDHITDKAEVEAIFATGFHHLMRIPTIRDPESAPAPKPVMPKLPSPPAA